MAPRPKRNRGGKKLSVGSALDEIGWEAGKRIKVKTGDRQPPLRRPPVKRDGVVTD